MRVQVDSKPAESEVHGKGARNSEILFSEEQQKVVGLRTAKVMAGTVPHVLSAPGQVAPNESQYAYITPRAAGVVRTVNAYVGQFVHAGDLLATIDSPVVGEARLELYTRLQELEIARAQADWEEMVYRNTNELIGLLRKGESPEVIQSRFTDRAVGDDRERLMTAYAQYRLAIATVERNRELNAQKLITPKQFQEVTAGYEVAHATYQSLMDQTGFEAKLANTRARQAKRQAETAVRTAEERLRIFGVKPDGTEPEGEGAKVVDTADGTLPAPEDSKVDESPVVTDTKVENQVAVKSVGVSHEAGKNSREAPVSTYSIRAPFDGTILDREMIVPGVAVDITHRIFTMANLSSVWIEASVHEGDFDLLASSHEGSEIRFRSPAYRDREFEGTVIYSGDLVDEKSRSIKLLAKAMNPDRLLKPGMFVEVEILSPRKKAAVQIPASALLDEGNRTFVFVKTSADRFVRREVDAEPPRGDLVTIRRGLAMGDEVVIAGEYKLKALSVQLASAGH
ncbi:efflux RND transporter periplasmic adaptor subunit [Singulisphaera sp. GP187]|uniref:efflux RND transporter periplasmic adaptor subunit n=1 Tax=Singulisphaera sp. GP187 TaxID=1882752 RepID=UPI0020B15A8B|nr:efflux RND transporter periplasmic adaptor subunit [Singulisphaera sp. GP187]